MNKQTRRNFLKTSLYTGATAAWTAKSWGQVKGANATLRCATVGFRSRGGSHISSITGMQKREQGVKLTALCDVDKKVLDAGAAKHKVKGYQDIREMLEKEDLDVVTVRLLFSDQC